MSLGNLYIQIKKDDPHFTRTVLPAYLLEHYNVDSIKLTEPDEYFPSTFPGQVPAFRYSSGRQLTESIPICLLIVDQIPNKGGLLGKDTPAEFAQVLKWMNIFNFELMDTATPSFKMLAGRMDYEKEAFQRGFDEARLQVEIINEHLKHQTYLVGESVTLADLYGVTMLLRPLTFLWDKEFRAQYPHFFRWYETVKAHPILRGHYDNIALVDKLKLPSE